MSEVPISEAAAAPFDVVLHPHRSLPQTGFVVLMIAVALVSFISGLMFWRLGAWPVTGFFGLDLLLLYLAFRWNYRAGRTVETVRLADGRLIVSRMVPGRRIRQWEFEPAWARVRVEGEGRHDRKVILSTRGRRLTLGAFLSPDERSSFAEALDAALRRHASALASRD